MRLIPLIALALLVATGLGQRPQTSTSPLGSVSGAVTDQDGRPLRSRITIYELTISDGRESLIAKGSAETDGDGLYRCDKLFAGKYIVLAHPAMQPEASDLAVPSTVRDPYSFTFYPNVRTVDEASVIDLHDAEARWAPFTLTPAHAEKIFGEILSHPRAATLALALHSGGFDVLSDLSVRYESSSGKFFAENVPDGQYRLTAEWFADGVDHTASKVIMVGPEPLLAVSFPSEPNAKVLGSVRLEQWPHQPLPPSLILESMSDSGAKIYSADIGRDGSFHFDAVREGQYLVETPLTGSLFVRTVSMQGRELPDEVLFITADSPLAPLDVELSTKAGSISGSVSRTDGNTGKVIVVIQSLEQRRIIVVNADLSHRFQLTGLGPGEYRLFAWPTPNDVAYRDPLALARFVDHSSSISLSDDARMTNVEVELLGAFHPN